MNVLYPWRFLASVVYAPFAGIAYALFFGASFGFQLGRYISWLIVAGSIEGQWPWAVRLNVTIPPITYRQEKDE